MPTTLVEKEPSILHKVACPTCWLQLISCWKAMRKYVLHNFF